MIEKDAPDADVFDAWFIETFARYWRAGGSSLTEGRIAGYLLLDDSEGVTAERLSADLGISRGAVSTYTRHLVDRGFVRRVRRPGVRSHFFVMDGDVWGGFLDTEQAYLRSQQRLAATALERVEPRSPSFERVRNMHDYMTWLLEVQMLPARWREHRRGLAERRNGDGTD